jgi:hypothetical protein
LEDLPEERRDLDGVLKKCLVPDQDMCDIFTFGCMAIRSDAWRGILRVRARPFADDKFHGNNPEVSLSFSLFLAAAVYLSSMWMQDAVLAIPGRPEWPRPAGSFNGMDQSHRDQMWVRCATVCLFFRCNFRRPGEGNELIPCTLALVNRLREFTVPEAGKSYSQC